MYNDEDDEEMEDMEEDDRQRELHGEEQEQQLEHDNEYRESNNDMEEDSRANDDFAQQTSTPSHQQQQPSISSPQQQQWREVSSRTSGRGRLTIVDYGHDEAAMSPEPEVTPLDHAKGRVFFSVNSLIFFF